MKKYVLALFALLVLLSWPLAAYAFEGPLLVRNQFPLFLPLNAPYLESARPENSFSLSLSHSNVMETGNGVHWTAYLDMELTELDILYKKRIGDLFELGIDVPFLRFSDGFMDGLLDRYHALFAAGGYGRDDRPANDFLYEVKHNNVVPMRGEAGATRMGDVRVTVKTAVLEDDPAVSVLVDGEFPTGDAEKGFGSGSFDSGVAVLIDKKLGSRFAAYGNLGAIFPGDLKWLETVALKNVIYAGLAVEADVLRDFSLLVQGLAQSSPFPKTGVRSIDDIGTLLTFGGRYSSGDNSVEFSVTEDPNTVGAPDISLNISFKRRL